MCAHVIQDLPPSAIPSWKIWKEANFVTVIRMIGIETNWGWNNRPATGHIATCAALEERLTPKLLFS